MLRQLVFVVVQEVQLVLLLLEFVVEQVVVEQVVQLVLQQCQHDIDLHIECKDHLDDQPCSDQPHPETLWQNLQVSQHLSSASLQSFHSQQDQSDSHHCQHLCVQLRHRLDEPRHLLDYHSLPVLEQTLKFALVELALILLVQEVLVKHDLHSHHNSHSAIEQTALESYRSCWQHKRPQHQDWH